MLSADVSEIEEQSNDSLSENDEEPSMDDEKPVQRQLEKNLRRKKNFFWAR